MRTPDGLDALPTLDTVAEEFYGCGATMRVHLVILHSMKRLAERFAVARRFLPAAEVAVYRDSEL
ncbi:MULTISPECIES: hypothetical protein [unclassified Sphingomonas]|uniref:hypothetical protein n=1 Tax=unclassified Sphingomonas TaxID=196159 RepID=UPI00092BF3B5|nr:MULTISPECIES: hypothetical protein [unclassified Sphingomonas]MBN8849731.1 hypothetical protein [Sphingomonas sp.]OJV34339.1 MAG: hypothetical protein BGO24_11590 [Sphingomonas sp. 67-36]